MKFNYFYVTVILVLFFIVNISAVEQVIEKKFSVSEGGWLKLESDLGSVEIESHSSNSVDVKVIKKVRRHFRGDDEELLDEFKVRFEQNGKDVFVYGEIDGSRSKKNSYLNVHYIINVPQKYNIDLHTAGGSISISDLTGEAITKTSGGSLSFGNISGPINGKTSGGSISVEGCIGNSKLNTSGGSISIGDADGDMDAHTSGGSITIESVKGDVDATTSGGSITIKEVSGNVHGETSGGFINCRMLNQPTSDCTLKTSGGTVTVYLPADAGVYLDAKTSGGQVTSDHQITIRGKISKNSLEGKVNNGGPELYIRTSGGDIRLLEL